MTIEEIVIREIKKNIAQLPPDDIEACNEMADHFRRMIRAAGHPVGTLAIALVGAEMQLDQS